MRNENIRKTVRKGYAKIARKTQLSCCSQDTSQQIGYSKAELQSVPEGADMSLGCGNPVALASLRKGETVIDLGSGGGLDCFLAAKKVGPEGRVIGVDMTPEMLDKARKNLKKSGHKNVEFRLGEIENLPIADNTANAIISNCVVNLSPDKKRVFEEAHRTLKPGGRLMISDIVLLKELPAAIVNSVRAYIGCLAGAVKKNEYLNMMTAAGFKNVKVVKETRFPIELMANDPTAQAVVKDLNLSADAMGRIVDYVASVQVSAIKPE